MTGNNKHSSISTREFAINFLQAIEDKYIAYFITSNRDIFDCVVIADNPMTSVHITDQNLPHYIKHDIESIFWLQ